MAVGKNKRKWSTCHRAGWLGLVPGDSASRRPPLSPFCRPVQGQEGWQEEDVSVRAVAARHWAWSEGTGFAPPDAGAQLADAPALRPSFCSVDPFSKKDWYDLRAPSMFQQRAVGKTLVTRTQGTKVRAGLGGSGGGAGWEGYSSSCRGPGGGSRATCSGRPDVAGMHCARGADVRSPPSTPPSPPQIASDGLKGRVLTVNLADLQNNEADAYRNIKLKVEDVQGRHCLTNFHGMDLTTDKLRSLVRKWQTLIEAHVDVKTQDGYTLRLFAIAFTKKRAGQVKKTAYAQSSQIRAIRKRMVDIMTREATSCDLKELVAKFIPEAIGKEMEKACQGIYPLQNTFVRKVKVLRAPKFDLSKLMEVHGDLPTETSVAVERPAEDVVGDTPVEAEA